MRREIVTLVAVLCLSGGYRLYSAVVVPWTESRDAPIAVEREQPVDFRPPIFTAVAERYFPDASWVADAQLKWQRSDEAFFFSQTVTPEPGVGNVVRMSPLAILWRDPRRPEAPPYRIQAPEGRVHFENEFFDGAFELSKSPGRIIGASLMGAVRIDGPDGLAIEGQDFVFSEENATLHSFRPVSFRHGPSARNQMQIIGQSEQLTLSFSPATESTLGRDMPRLAGLSQVWLRGKVRLDAGFVLRGVPQQARITCANGMDYDVEKHEAKFQSQVHVARRSLQQEPPVRDDLHCEWLLLSFLQDPEKAGAGEALFSGLQFHKLRATSTAAQPGVSPGRVKLTSQERQLTITTQDLNYDALTRDVVLMDDQEVRVQRGPAEFKGRWVRLQHSEDGGLHLLKCVGPGMVRMHHPRLGPDPFECEWREGVDIVPEGDADRRLVQLRGESRLLVPGRLGLAANMIQMWMDLADLSEDGVKGNLLERPLPLHRAVAQGDVRLGSAALNVDRADVIEVDVSPAILPKSLEQADSQNTASGRRDPLGTTSNRPPWFANADRFHVLLGHDPNTAQIDVQRVTGVGQVALSHEPAPKADSSRSLAQGPIRLSGAQFVADNSGGLKQVVTLYGLLDEKGVITQPAEAAIGSSRIRGGSLMLDREANLLLVEGAGELAGPIPRGVGGLGGANPSAAGPATLVVNWWERMTFDGQLIQFLGAVKAAVEDQRGNTFRLQAEDVQVRLTQRVQFNADASSGRGDLEIATLTARHDVDLESYEFLGTDLIGVRHGALSELQLDQGTGQFTGRGSPGTIQIWSKGDALKLAPTEAPAANQPRRTSEPRWRYTQIRFAGPMHGNLNTKEAVLEDRVEILSAPVAKALVKFHRNQLEDDTEDARNAVWLGCEKLTARQRPVAGADKSSTELFATGGAVLEGKLFRAIADELTFDELEGKFVLRGLGKDATLHFQRSPQEAAEPSSHRLIQFTPAKRSITVDGSTGVSGGF